MESVLDIQSPQTNKVFGIMVCSLILVIVLTGSNVTSQQEPKVSNDLFVPGVLINVINIIFMFYLLYLDIVGQTYFTSTVSETIPVSITSKWDRISPCINVTKIKEKLLFYLGGYVYILVLLLGSVYALAYGILTINNISEEDNSYSTNKELFSMASLLVGSVGIMLVLADITCNTVYLARSK